MTARAHAAAAASVQRRPPGPGLLHAVRALASGQRPPGLARRWQRLFDRGLVLGTLDAPEVSALGRASIGLSPLPRVAVGGPVQDLDAWNRTESYFTGGWIVEQGLRIVLPGASRIVELGAGAGVFAQRARGIDSNVRVWGVELRADEAAAARHYEELFIGDMFKMRRDLARLRPELVVSNPPFSYTRLAAQLALDIVVPGGEVLFLVRADWGGAEADWDFLLEDGPAKEYLLGGRPRYRPGQVVETGGSKAVNDLQGAKWLRWRRGPERNSSGEWPKRMLPRLPSAALGWSERPGTEETISPLPSIYYPEVC